MKLAMKIAVDIVMRSMDDQEVVQQVRAGMMINSRDFPMPTACRRFIASSRPGRQAKRKTSSLSFRKVLAPNLLARWAVLALRRIWTVSPDEGIWFTQLYATGVRSARGLEAIVSGFTPTPSKSVVKLGRSQRNFFTLAGLLKNSGYDTSFIYGGRRSSTTCGDSL